MRVPAPGLAALATLALLAAAMPAAAHSAPPARAFETRLLHDHNDDSALVLAGRHGFDAIALDARAAWLPGEGEALVLRLLLNGGCDPAVPTPCPELRQVVRFDAPPGPQEVTFATTDGGATWTGNAARYVGPEGVNDGTRFAIEAWVPFTAFGAVVGDRLTGWFVDGFAGTEQADDMPAGPVPGAPDPLGAAYQAQTYSLSAPTGYVQLAAEVRTLHGHAHNVTEFPVRLANLLPVEQVANLTVSGPAQALLDGAPATQVALAPNFTAELVLRITLPNGTAPVVVTVTTPLGGHAVFAVNATGMGTAHGAGAGDGEHHTHDDGDGRGDGPEIPAPAAVPLAALAVALAFLRRRGR